MENLRLKYAIRGNDVVLDGGDKEYVLKIRDLDESDRPREKLIKNGPSVLSAAELLAVVLNVGTRKEEVFRMTRRILKEYGEKNIVNQVDARALAEEIKIPLGKACQIAACFELGRRFFKEGNGRHIAIRTARQAYQYLKDMDGLPKEQLRGLYLNSRYCLVREEVISVGTLTSNLVHPREVLRPAIECSAAAIIIAHNHPSGSTKATVDDVETTRQLTRAAKIMGIDLLDHIIIAGNKFASVPGEYNT